MALIPFFINYATEREMTLCLCKLCPNTRLLFDSIMPEERKLGGEIFKSVTEFFTAKWYCTLSSNGFYNWACVTGKCKQCSKVKHEFPGVAFDRVITSSQFEQKETPYLEKDKSGNIVEKKSKKPDRVYHSISFKKTVTQLIALKWKYLTYKYQVCNDSYHWPQILNTTGDFGSMYHMNYSGSTTQSIKYEPHESHFNKKTVL